MIRSSYPLALKRSSATTRTLRCISTTRVTSHWKPTIKKLLAPFAISWAASSRPRPPLRRSVRLCVTKGNGQKLTMEKEHHDQWKERCDRGSGARGLALHVHLDQCHTEIGARARQLRI